MAKKTKQDATPAGNPIKPVLSSSDSSDLEVELEEHEPYLGLWWAMLMLALYLIKEAVPAERFSFVWWVQAYVLAVVVFVTCFTLFKRYSLSRRIKKTGGKNIYSVAQCANLPGDENVPPVSKDSEVNAKETAEQ